MPRMLEIVIEKTKKWLEVLRGWRVDAPSPAFHAETGRNVTWLKTGPKN